MFSKSRIEEISKQSKAERWPFPKTFETMKEAGVDYYDVDVATHQITYHGDDTSFTEDVPGFLNLQVAEHFEKQAVSDAIRHHQKEKTSYNDFLQSIANAGVKFYRVDMGDCSPA